MKNIVIVNVVISFKVQMLQILPWLSSKDYLMLPVFCPIVSQNIHDGYV